MESDFPAAHSMDTAFFAVDRDGHVAYFTTGEAGALPHGAAQEDPAETRRQLARLVPRSEAMEDLPGRVFYGPYQPLHTFTPDRDPHATLYFLKSVPDFLEPEIGAGRAVRVPATTGVAVFSEHLPRHLAERLHKEEWCLGCFWHHPRETNPEPDDDYPDLAQHGVFVYGHLCENWISGPYGRETMPRRPVHIDELPPALRRVLQGLRFEGFSFAETPHIQPAEHDECVSWEPAYLAIDGRTVRPMPGLEDQDQYFEAIQNMSDQKGLVFDPPLPPEEAEE